MWRRPPPTPEDPIWDIDAGSELHRVIAFAAEAGVKKIDTAHAHESVVYSWVIFPNDPFDLTDEQRLRVTTPARELIANLLARPPLGTTDAGERLLYALSLNTDHAIDEQVIYARHIDGGVTTTWVFETNPRPNGDFHAVAFRVD